MKGQLKLLTADELVGKRVRLSDGGFAVVLFVLTADTLWVKTTNGRQGSARLESVTAV